MKKMINILMHSCFYYIILLHYYIIHNFLLLSLRKQIFAVNNERLKERNGWKILRFSVNLRAILMTFRILTLFFRQLSLENIEISLAQCNE